MGKAAGDEELPFVLFAQLYAAVLAECRGRLAQVDCNVQHLTFYDTY